jgi:hypothetical protein
MLKYLAGLVLVFGLAVYISVQDERTAQQTTQTSEKLDKGTLSAKADENHPPQNLSNPERDSPRWYRFFRWPDGTTAWMIVLTLMAIAEQANESAKATQAMRRSTDLQVVGLNQWVEVGDWQGGEDIWKPDAEPEQPDHLMFKFSIENPTNYPMILKAARWKIGGQEESISPSCTLPPKGVHPTLAYYDLTAEEMLLYAKTRKRLELEVSGSIDFEDVLHNAQTQPFWVAFHCIFESGIWITKPYKTAAWVQNPEIQKKKDEDEQKPT